MSEHQISQPSAVPANERRLISSTLFISVPNAASFLEKLDHKTEAVQGLVVRILGRCALLGFAGFGVLAAIYVMLHKLFG